MLPGVAILAAAILAAACGGPTAVDPASIEVPEPDMTQVEVRLQSQVKAMRDRVAGLLRDETVAPAEGAAALGELGMLYHVYELREAAGDCYRGAESLDPENFRWAHLAGLNTLDVGDFDGAASDFRRALELEPDSVATRLRLGDIDRDLGRWEDARGAYEAVLAREADNASAVFGLAQVEAGTGNHQQARELFERALRLRPDAVSVRFPLAQSLRALGEVDAARDQLKLAGNRELRVEDPVAAGLARAQFNTVVAVIRTLVQEPGDMPDRELLNFAINKSAGDPAFLEVLGRDLQLLAEGSKPRARMHYVLGGLRVARGEDVEAIEQFRAALTIDLAMQDAHVKLGNALMRRGEAQLGLNHFERALELDPKDRDAGLKYATALLNTRQADRAGRVLIGLRSMHPGDPDVRVRLAELTEMTGDHRGARKLYEEALALELGDKDRARVHHGYGGFLRRRGMTEEALAQFEQARSADGDLITSRLDLAALLGQLGRFDEAAEQYRGVITDKPDNERARVGEVAALMLSERYGDARTRLMEGVAAQPGSLELSHLLARVLAAHPSSELRDGARALELARSVYDGDPRATRAETVAMAYAELGQFDQAASWQDRAASADPAPAGAAQRLRQYRSGQPFRASGPGDYLAVDPAGSRG
ncbi:hypothetical protein ABI59_21255 [Acidobacteria bacterium Mor1]|nr:hypothetical protein ABI59_21255 [Acidobacteria bacterium Mor1]